MHHGTSRLNSISAFFSLVFACLGYGPSTHAGEFTVFTKTYVHAAGTPETIEDSFDVLNPSGSWIVRVIILNDVGENDGEDSDNDTDLDSDNDTDLDSDSDEEDNDFEPDFTILLNGGFGRRDQL